MDLSSVLFAPLIGLTLFVAPTTVSDSPELKLYPAAKAGMERYVIELPKKERQEAEGLKVEIMVGKEMPTDGVNKVALAVAIKACNLDGWGTTYYELAPPLEFITTAIGVPEGTPQVTKFVSAPGIHLPYHSSNPIVVYVPKGYEARYRIWKASETTTTATKK